jgi:sugar-specific transcriptional regulator TrmB
MHTTYNNTELVMSLEEFGLSKYEAKAYLTMIGKGSLPLVK